MLKVLHVITRLTLGGAQETVLYYFNHLNREKFDVYFISGEETEFQEEEVLKKLVDNPKFTFVRNLKNSINPIKDILGIWEIYNFIKKNNIDIVHTHSAKAGFLGRVAAKLASVPVIVHTVHGWSFNPIMKPLVRKIYIFLEKLMARYSTKLITVTRTDIDKGIKKGIGKREKYTVIRSGIDFSKFNNIDENSIIEFKRNFNDKKLVGAIGRLSAPKNYPDFINIAKELCRRRQDIHFVIVGEGELRGEIEDYIEKKNMKEHVTLLGLRKDVNSILRSLDVLVLTSLWEGLPRVLPEAMYCGVPIVSNRIDGAKEIIKDGLNGLLVEPGDFFGAVAAIEKLLNNSNVRKSIILNAKQGVEEYSASRMIEDTEELYLDLYLHREGK